MDLPVAATVHLKGFSDKTEVRKLLWSHGFVLTNLSSDQLRVKGSFLKLTAVKASLERLLHSQTKTDITQVPKASNGAGAISKHPNRNSFNRGRDKPPHASPSSATASLSRPSGSSNKHPTSPDRASFSPTPDQLGSIRHGRESFVVDIDLFRYADLLRKKDIEGILYSHIVTMEIHEIGDSVNITVLGKSARTAIGKLQSLLNDLNQSLCTQEVPLKDMDREGKALLEKIRKGRNIYNSVLVCQTNDSLHLVGPSGESFKLQQKLLGRPDEQSRRTGRALSRNSRERSSSLPPLSHKNTRRDSGAVDELSPAAGYSPSAEPERRAVVCFGGSLRKRKRSEPRRNPQAEVVNVQLVESKTPKSHKVFSRVLQFLKIYKRKV